MKHRPDFIRQIFLDYKSFANNGPVRVRKENVLRQLSKLLEEEVRQPITCFDKVWDDEYVLEGNLIIERPHPNNSHPALQMEYKSGKLLKQKLLLNFPAIWRTR